MAVEWHTHGQYRISFDVRPDASRFIVVTGGECIARGLIDEDYVVYDSPDQKPPALVEQTLVRKWREMRARERQKPWPNEP